MIRVIYYDNKHDMSDEQVTPDRALYLLGLYSTGRWIVDLEMFIDGKQLDCSKLVKTLKL